MQTSERALTEGNLRELREKVRPRLTDKRYLHTLAVEKEAAALGAIFLPEKIPSLRAAALLHDITKKQELPEQLQLCREFGIIPDEEELLSPAVFHAKTAAAVAGRDFAEYTDDEILSGIRWHTTGHRGMTLFESLVYLADYIEETRTFEDCRKLRRLFYEKLEKGEEPRRVLLDTMIASFDLTIRGLLEDGVPVAVDSAAARNDFLVERAKAEKR